MFEREGGAIDTGFTRGKLEACATEGRSVGLDFGFWILDFAIQYPAKGTH
ncbi:MAG: hypothetical protein HC769_29755 [Cyanobacteria bacterium CRU_2_1]|nr:hypothetical protein [Cyanobacteria bacterium RU_5_0]NJR62617.1 hypothetical protein [Cyanobacteria bacterium CRU_2_1]